MTMSGLSAGLGDLSPPAPAIPGYRILERLGEGSAAITYLAEQGSEGRQVALKVLRDEISRDDAFRERFLEEMRKIAQLHHPKIVGIHEVGCGAGYCYISQEYLPRLTLREEITGGMDPKRAIFIAKCIGYALGYAHKCGHLHEHVRPHKVYFRADRNASAALAGFEMAWLRGSGAIPLNPAVDDAVYASPEQLRGDALDERSDLYALGVMLFEMLAGHRPPRDVETHGEGDWRIPALPAAVADFQPIMDLCLAERPEDRFSSAYTLIDALRELEVNCLSQGHWRAADEPDDLGSSPPPRALGGDEPAEPGLEASLALSRDTPPVSVPSGAASSRRRLGRWLGALAVLGGACAALGFGALRWLDVEESAATRDSVQRSAAADVSVIAVDAGAETAAAAIRDDEVSRAAAPSSPAPPFEPTAAAQGDGGSVSTAAAADPDALDATPLGARTETGAEAAAPGPMRPDPSDAVARQGEVDRLLADAKVLTASGRLIETSGAVDAYLAARALEPSSAAVVATGRALGAELRRQAGIAEVEGQLERALALVARALELAPEDGALRGRRDAIAERLERRAELAALSAAAKRQLASSRFVTPAGDNALESFERMLALDPGSAEAKAGKLELARREEALARRLLEERRFDKALKQIALGLKAVPDDLALTRLREETLAAQQRQRAEEALPSDGNAAPADQTTPRDVKPRDAKPRDAKPRDMKPRDMKPRDAKPPDAKPRRDVRPRQEEAPQREAAQPTPAEPSSEEHSPSIEIPRPAPLPPKRPPPPPKLPDPPPRQPRVFPTF